jgi:hypothetical protein
MDSARLQTWKASHARADNIEHQQQQCVGRQASVNPQVFLQVTAALYFNKRAFGHIQITSLQQHRYVGFAMSNAVVRCAAHMYLGVGEQLNGKGAAVVLKGNQY